MYLRTWVRFKHPGNYGGALLWGRSGPRLCRSLQLSPERRVGRAATQIHPEKDTPVKCMTFRAIVRHFAKNEVSIGHFAVAARRLKRDAGGPSVNRKIFNFPLISAHFPPELQKLQIPREVGTPRHKKSMERTYIRFYPAATPLARIDCQEMSVSSGLVEPSRRLADASSGCGWHTSAEFRSRAGRRRPCRAKKSYKQVLHRIEALPAAG